MAAGLESITVYVTENILGVLLLLALGFIAGFVVRFIKWGT